jgi:hypothetical protein
MILNLYIARPFKSRSQRFLSDHFRVREHLLFGLRRLTPVDVSASNEYCFN